MPHATYTRNEYEVEVLEWTGTNLEDVEALLGVDVIYWEGDTNSLSIGSSGGRVAIPTGYNIIATAPTAYDVGPPVVTFVPGVFVTVVSDAVLASDYTVVP